MPRPTKGKRLGGSPSHQKAILANLSASLFWEEQDHDDGHQGQSGPAIRGEAHHQGQGWLAPRSPAGAQVIENSEVVTKLFDEIGPQYAERPGGYTRIVKIGPRRGDNAEMAIIELV